MYVEEILEEASKNAYYLIDNNSAKTIVLFGNCQMGAIGSYLNLLTNKQFNIYITTAFIFPETAIRSVEQITKIWKIIAQSDIFIYQQHHSDYEMDATHIETYANQTKILIPNLQLYFMDPCAREIEIDALIYSFNYSYNKTKLNIESSDFPNFMFILDNYQTIRFFDIPTHPTMYILYLMAYQIYLQINNNNHKLTIDDYHALKNNDIYMCDNVIYLGGYYPYKNTECEALGINIYSEHYIHSLTYRVPIIPELPENKS